MIKDYHLCFIYRVIVNNVFQIVESERPIETVGLEFKRKFGAQELYPADPAGASGLSEMSLPLVAFQSHMIGSRINSRCSLATTPLSGPVGAEMTRFRTSISPFADVTTLVSAAAFEPQQANKYATEQSPTA